MKRNLLAAAIFVVALIVEYVLLDWGTYEGLEQAGVALVAFGAMTVILKGRARDVALMATSFAIGMAVLESVALLLEPKSPQLTEQGMTQLRPYIGYGAGKPGVYAMKHVSSAGKVLYDTKATIGEDLWRVTNGPKGPGAIAFFGDSFTFGTGVNDQDTITQAFADETHGTFPVPNLSYFGWSPANNLATLQHDVQTASLAKARRFVLMTGIWHVERTACHPNFTHWSPRYDLDANGKLVEAGICFGEKTLARELQGIAIYRDYLKHLLKHLSRREVDTYFAIVTEFVRLAKDKYGVPTTIIVLPGRTEPGLDDATYLERLKTTGADIVIDPLQAANRKADDPYTIAGDGHPTPLANHVLAKILVDYFKTKQPGTLPAEAASAEAKP